MQYTKKAAGRFECNDSMIGFGHSMWKAQLQVRAGGRHRRCVNLGIRRVGVVGVWFNQEPDMGKCLLVMFQSSGRHRYSFSGVHELPELLHCEVNLSLFASGMPILAIELCNQCKDSFAGRHGCYGE